MLRTSGRSASRRMDVIPVRATAVDARGPALLGPTAMASFALGAAAFGAVAIGRLVIGRAVIKRLVIEDLEVQRLRVADLEVVNERRSLKEHICEQQNQNRHENGRFFPLSRSTLLWRFRRDN